MIPDLPELERLYAYPDAGRPWVRTNFVTTLDGAATGVDGVSGTLGGATDTRTFALLRSLADVIVVGAGTARAEGYGPIEVDPDVRRRNGLSAAPPLVLVSRTLDVPEALTGPGTVVLTTAGADPVAAAALRETTEVLSLGDAQIDWTATFAEFTARGWLRVLCEGGPALHGELVELDLVDELCLTIAPLLATGTAPRIAHSSRPTHLPMVLGHAIEADGGLMTRWVRPRDETMTTANDRGDR